MSDFQMNYPLLNAAGPILYCLADFQCNGHTITLSGSKLVASTTQALGEHIFSNSGADNVAEFQNTSASYYSAVAFKNNNGLKVTAIGIGNTGSTVGLRDRFYMHGNTLSGAFATIPPVVDLGQDFNYSSGGYLPHTYIACLGGDGGFFGTAIYGLHATNAQGPLGVFVNHLGNVGIGTTAPDAGPLFLTGQTVHIKTNNYPAFIFEQNGGRKWAFTSGDNTNSFPLLIQNMTGTANVVSIHGTAPDSSLNIGATGIVSTGVSLGLKSYTVVGVPAATAAGQMIYVSNESGGAVPAFSDGTNWRRVTDRAIIS